MIVIQNTTSTLVMQAGSNPGADVPIHVTFDERIDSRQVDKGSALPDIQNPQIQHSKLANGGTTEVIVLSAPAAGRRRILKSLMFKNTGSGTVIYKFRVEDSSATPADVEVQWSLLTGESGYYEDGRGWYFMDANGNLK